MSFIDNFYKNADNLSISQEPLIKYEETKNFVHISSVDRNLTAYPQPQEYSIKFDNEYRNITSVRLINAILPKANNVDLEPYLVLQIDELPNVCLAQSADAPKDAFLVLYFEQGVGNFLTIKSDNCNSLVKTYKTPLAKLDRLTVRILDYTGTPFNFGAETSPIISKNLQNSFLFEITTIEKTRRSLETRAVF